MVLTGRSWMRSPNNMRGVPTLPRLLEAAGYRTFITGKWHNGEEALLRSFDRGTAVYLGGMADHTQVEVQNIENGGMVRRRVGEKFSSELFADAVIDFLDEQVGRILPSWTKTVRRRTRSSSTPRTTGWRSAATACWASRTCTSTRCAAR